MVENPNWQEADQLAIYKRGRGVELGATEKQLLLAVRAGLEPGTSAFQVPNPLDHAVMLLLRKIYHSQSTSHVTSIFEIERSFCAVEVFVVPA